MDKRSIEYLRQIVNNIYSVAARLKGYDNLFSENVEELNDVARNIKIKLDGVEVDK